MGQIMTQDRRTLEVIQLAKTVAQSKASILIQGESGTGKELLAKLIHENSSRTSRAFVAINCAAIPDNLLESELFGFERGAFTGADQARPGKFELAHGGTILLDEISEMDLRLQAKLLRVLQQGEVDRIGSRKPISVDVRVVATTNRNLADCVRDGTFREDLFYRLNVVNLTLPPLRERMGDVRQLAVHFLKQFSNKAENKVDGISREAMEILEGHSWPGNIRELEHAIERAILVSKGTLVTSKDIQIEQRQRSVEAAQLSNAPPKNWAPGKTLDEVERNVILQALEYHRGNRTHTARALGISIRTLRNKLSDYRKSGLNV